MAARAGVRFQISADDRNLRRGLGRARGQVDSFTKGIGKLGALGGGGLAGLAGGLVSIGGAAGFVKESANATMQLYRASVQLSRVTGYDLQTSSAWISLAKERGISTEQLARGYTTLARQVRAAQSGSERARATFEQLGVSQRDLARGDTSVIIGKIADAFKNHADGGGKAAVASQLFGRSYSGMLAVLNKGGPALRALIREQVRHGAVLTGNGKDLARAREAQLRWNMTLERLKITVGRAVIPELTKLGNRMSDWLGRPENQRRLRQTVLAFLQMGRELARVAAYLAPVVRRIANFTAQHPELAKIVGQLIAVRVAIRLISFANPVRGLIGFATRMRGLPGLARQTGSRISAGLTSAWPAAARGFGRWQGPLTKLFRGLGAVAAVAFIAEYGPKIASDIQNIYNQVVGNRTNQPWWKSALKIGGAVVGGVGGFLVAGPAGAVLGAGLGYSAASAGLGMLGGGGGGGTRGRGRGASGGAGGGGSSAGLGALPSFEGVDLGTGGGRGQSSSGSGARPKDKRPGQILAAAQKVYRRFTDAKARADDADTRLWARGIDPNTPKGARERERLLESARGEWQKTRPALAAAARDAARHNYGGTANRIVSMIHSGDRAALELKAQLNEAKANRPQDGPDPSALLEQTNRRLAAAQAARQADDTFIRAAFTAGDIGAGGMNAYAAAGGLGAGAQVQGGSVVRVTINSLHPGDAKTKSDIARVVTTALGGQGKRGRSRSSTGGRR